MSLLISKGMTEDKCMNIPVRTRYYSALSMSSLPSCDTVHALSKLVYSEQPNMSSNETQQPTVIEAASDQGLYCLLTGISIRNRIKMKTYTRHA